jgi:hypothetical protein
MFKSFKYKRGYVGKEEIDPGNSNNISILLVEETRVPKENHRPAASHK